MNPDEKITSVPTDENLSDSSGDSAAEPSVLLEKRPQAQSQPQDQELLNVQSTSAGSQGVQSNSSEIINASQELNLQTEKQLPVNPPQSSSQCVESNLEDVELRTVTTRISPEPNFQFENQPSASQSVPKLSVDDKCSIQSDYVEIQISPQNESQIEQQSELSEAENRAKEDKNISIQRAEDAIDELSDALPSPTNPSSSEVEKTKPSSSKVEDSRMRKFLKSRITIARSQLKRFDYAVLFAVSFIAQVAYPVIYASLKTDGGYDILLSFLIANPICWAIALFMDRYLLTEKFYSVFPCCKSHKVKYVVKRSQHTPSVEPNAAFQHEIANVEEVTKPQDLPPISESVPGSLDSCSIDQTTLLQLIANEDCSKENAESPEYEGACGYSPAFASGACGYSPGLGEGSTDFRFTDRPSESHVVINVDIHKEHERAEDPAEAESQLVINVDVHKEHESSENSAEAASECGHSSGSGGEKTSHDP